MSTESGLQLLLKPFEKNLIGKLPNPTRAQTDEVKANFRAGIRCKLCGAWHHPDVVHIDYVGHAALTHRLLEADIKWNWEPLAFDADGLPRFDKAGGLWIKLTVDGVTRLGYGNAPKRGDDDPGKHEKEAIGDALRNAAMRFGAALDLWHKGDLIVEDETPKEKVKDAKPSTQVQPAKTSNKPASNANPGVGAKPDAKSGNEHKAPQINAAHTRDVRPISGEQCSALLRMLDEKGKNGSAFFSWLESKFSTRNPMSLKIWQYDEVMETLRSTLN